MASKVGFKITAESDHKLLYEVELKVGKKESAIEVRFGLDNCSKNDTLKKRTIESYDQVCSYITEDEFISFLKDKLELSQRVKSIVLPLSKIEWMTHSYKTYKKTLTA